MACTNTNNNTLRIPYGNDFRLVLCNNNIAPSNPQGVTFANVSKLDVWLVYGCGCGIPTGFEVLEGGDLLIHVPASAQEIGRRYAIELSGTYQGHPWRWKCREVFRIVDTNCEASEQPLETFGVETYYLRDVLWVEDDGGGTLMFTTHGHVKLDNGTLDIQGTDNCKVTVEGDTLVFTVCDDNGYGHY